MGLFLDSSLLVCRNATDFCMFVASILTPCFIPQFIQNKAGKKRFCLMGPFQKPTTIHMFGI